MASPTSTPPLTRARLLTTSEAPKGREEASDSKSETPFGGQLFQTAHREEPSEESSRRATPLPRPSLRGVPAATPLPGPRLAESLQDVQEREEAHVLLNPKQYETVLTAMEKQEFGQVEKLLRDPTINVDAMAGSNKRSLLTEAFAIYEMHIEKYTEKKGPKPNIWEKISRTGLQKEKLNAEKNFENSFKILTLVFSKSSDAKEKNHIFQTLIHSLSIKRLEHFLGDKHIDLNTRVEDATHLFTALRYSPRASGVVDRLLSHPKVDPNQQDITFANSSHLKAENLVALLESGRFNLEGKDPFLWIVHNGNLDCIRSAWGKIEKKNFTAEEKTTILSLAFLESLHTGTEEVLKFLIKDCGFNVTSLPQEAMEQIVLDLIGKSKDILLDNIILADKLSEGAFVPSLKRPLVDEEQKILGQTLRTTFNFATPDSNNHLDLLLKFEPNTATIDLALKGISNRGSSIVVSSEKKVMGQGILLIAKYLTENQSMQAYLAENPATSQTLSQQLHECAELATKNLETKPARDLRSYVRTNFLLEPKPQNPENKE